MGEQRVDVSSGRSAEAEKNIFEPGAEVHLIRFASSGKTLQDSEVSTAAFAAGEKPVFSSKRNRADHIFHWIIVDIQFGIGQKFRQCVFQVQGVVDRFSQGRRRNFFIALPSAEVKEVAHQGSRCTAGGFPFLEQCRFGPFLLCARFRPRLNLIQITDDFESVIGFQVSGVPGIEQFTANMSPTGGKVGVEVFVADISVPDNRSEVIAVEFFYRFSPRPTAAASAHLQHRQHSA